MTSTAILVATNGRHEALNPLQRNESPERRQHPCQDMGSRITDVTQRREHDGDQERRPRRLDGELQDVAAELEATSDRRRKGSQRDRDAEDVNCRDPPRKRRGPGQLVGGGHRRADFYKPRGGWVPMVPDFS